MATYHFKREPWGPDHEHYDRIADGLVDVVDALTGWRDATLRLEEIEAERDTLQERVEELEAKVAELEEALADEGGTLSQG